MKVVQEGTEGQAVSPGCAEVCDLHPLVPVGDALAPLQQRLAGVHQVLQGEDDVRERSVLFSSSGGYYIHLYLSSVILPISPLFDHLHRIWGFFFL